MESLLERPQHVPPQERLADLATEHEVVACPAVSGKLVLRLARFVSLEHMDRARGQEAGPPARVGCGLAKPRDLVAGAHEVAVNGQGATLEVHVWPGGIDRRDVAQSGCSGSLVSVIASA